MFSTLEPLKVETQKWFDQFSLSGFVTSSELYYKSLHLAKHIFILTSYEDLNIANID